MACCAPEDVDYVCTLEDKWIKKAKDELFEIPEDRLAAVQAFRDWIKTQKHIQVGQLDTITLLNFLRWAKYSQIKAREKFQAYLSVRDVAPAMFVNIDTTEKLLAKIVDTGYASLLPTRDQNGCQIMLMRFEAYNKKEFAQADFFRLMTAAVMFGLRTEASQVNGVVIIIDWSNVNASGLAAGLDRKAKPMKKAFINNMPIRMKMVHHYNAGLLVDTFMVFAKAVMPKKLYERMKMHDTVESLYKYVPKECLPEEYLPDDYTGPNAGSIKSLGKKLLSDLQEDEFRKYLLHMTSDQFKIDSSMKPTEEVTQHFRKLNVD